MKKYLFTILIASILVGGCTLPKSSVNSEDDCIPPLFDIAFPVMVQTPSAVTPRQIPPQGNWRIQDALPFPQDQLSYLGVRTEQNELWFKVSESNLIYRYFIKNQQWKSYPADELTLRTPDNLFVANDGTVWSAGIRFSDPTLSEESLAFLSRFNDELDRFEYVEDISGFLQYRRVRLISNIAKDQSGRLWFFVESDKNTLVSFDIKTGQSQRHYSFDIAGGNPSIAIGLDGSVWFQNFANDRLVQYIPSSQKTHTYEMYPEGDNSSQLSSDLRKANYLFFDYSGRLWFANYAWLNFLNDNLLEWHQIIDSPVFVTDHGLPDSQYFMAYQYSTYQSSNGWYWFTGGNGITRLDLEQGSWCQMTTGISDVVEDSGHNLWIAVFGHLYKYSLNR